MTVVEIIIAELHCLSNGWHRVDCSASYVCDGRGALSMTVVTVSIRTKRMLSMFRLRNKKCSETGPNQCCSGPEQYQKQFRFDLYFICRIRLTDNCILRHLAAENIMINYLSRHFDYRKIPVPRRCRLGIWCFHRTFDVPVLCCIPHSCMFGV